MIRTVTSREFNQDVSKIKHAAESGPVFITDRGRAAHVLLSIADYEKLVKKNENIVDLLAMSNMDDIDFEPEKLGEHILKPQEFE